MFSFPALDAFENAYYERLCVEGEREGERERESGCLPARERAWSCIS